LDFKTLYCGVQYFDVELSWHMKSVCHANCSLLRASTGILKPNFAEDVPILSTGESLCARLGVGHKLIDTPDLDLRLHMTPFVTASSN